MSATSGAPASNDSARTPERVHAPGLDGIRGLAVAAIVAYHVGLIGGGLLSVSVFFTLSGYLITSILLFGWWKSGAIDLKTFWLRRARRLLPALFLLLPVVLFAAALSRPNKLAAYGREALSAAFYMANWTTIARGDDYFNRFGGPGPFDHLWSLAIEEQFYVLWPLLLLVLLLVVRRRGETKPRAPVFAIVVTTLLTVASALCMAWRYSPDAMNNTRAYEGTDTRAAAILVGALAAMIVPLSRAREGGRARRVVLEILGVVSAAVLAKVVLGVDDESPWIYRGGESLTAVATAVLIVSAAHPATFVGRALGVSPLRWLGVRTYGIYLWHMPIVAFMPASLLESHPLARAALLCAMTLTIAALSFAILEDPFRRNGFAAFVRSGGWSVGRRWAGVVVLAPLAVASLGAWPWLSPASASEIDFETLTTDLTPEGDPAPASLELDSVASADPVVAPTSALTSCKQLVHVGDSTSIALVSKSYLPSADDRLDARYRGVGVRVFVAEISGGRSIVEKFHDQESAYEIVASRTSGGYRGCWVMALGNGDAATIHGNVAGLSQRIDWVMKAAAGAPVLWATTKTLLEKGPYKNAYMQAWNDALVQACARHPNLRVFDWAGEVQDEWFISDKIHPNPVGAKERASRFARALALAFPKDAPPSAQCIVHSTP